MNIKRIAELSNVSASTVSKILNNKHKNISNATVEKVLKVANENNYRPYNSIREKILNKSKLIALISPYSAEVDSFYNILNKKLQEKEYKLIFFHTSDVDCEIEAIKKINDFYVEGAIVNLKKSDKTANLLEKMDIPIAYVDNEIKKTYSINFDYDKALREAIAYLKGFNHNKIALLKDKSKDSFLDVLDNSDIKYMFEVDKIDSLIVEEVSAVICESINSYTKLFEYCYSRNIQVPLELSIILLSKNFEKQIAPRPTTFHFNVNLAAEKTLQYIFNVIENKDLILDDDYKVPVVFHEGQTVSVPYNYNNLEKKYIVILGSLNIDIIKETDYIPNTGNVTIVNNIYNNFGGKGGNQAVGVSKMLGNAHLLACTGDDFDGRKIITYLRENNVDVSGVIKNNKHVTGKAYITIANNGDSIIEVYKGANDHLSMEHVLNFKELIKEASYCLVQDEIKKQVVEETIKLANDFKVKCIYKPATLKSINEKILKNLFLFVPNKLEAERLVPNKMTIEEQGDYFLSLGIKNVIITLGEKGCYYCNKNSWKFYPAAPFYSLDNTGASDAFISTLAVYLCEDKTMEEAIAYATYAAGLSVTKKGVENALPNRSELEAYEKEILNLIVLKDKGSDK